MEINKEIFKEIIGDYLGNLAFDWNQYWVFDPECIPDTIELRDYEIGIDYIDKPKIISHKEWKEDTSHSAWEKRSSKTELFFEDVGYHVVIDNSMNILRLGGDIDDESFEVEVYKDSEVTDNDIKKFLLKGKPEASFDFIRKGKAYYYVNTFIADGSIPTGRITFEIPVEDMGEADFKSKMDGNLLLRWIYSYTQKK